MPDIHEATRIAQTAFPDGRIEATIEYKNLFVFQMFVPEPLETLWDPWYSVDKSTGEFRDFSILEDGNVEEILTLVRQAKGGN